LNSDSILLSDKAIGVIIKMIIIEDSKYHSGKDIIGVKCNIE